VLEKEKRGREGEDLPLYGKEGSRNKETKHGTLEILR